MNEPLNEHVAHPIEDKLRTFTQKHPAVQWGQLSEKEGRNANIFRIDIPIDGELYLTSIVKVLKPENLGSMHIQDEIDAYILAKSRGVNHMPMLLACDRSTSTIHISFIHSQVQSAELDIAANPVPYFHATFEALSDFDQAGVRIIDIAKENSVYFLDANQQPRCIFIDLSWHANVSVLDLEPGEQVVFSMVRRIVAEYKGSAFDRWKAVESYTTDYSTWDLQPVIDLGFTEKQAQLLIQWYFLDINSKSLIDQEKMFLAETKNGNHIKTIPSEIPISMVDTPNAYSDALKIQSELSETLGLKMI